MRLLILALVLSFPLYGQYDYSLALSGPKTAWPGYRAILQIEAAIVSGDGATIQYTINDAPGTATTPILENTCCGPLSGFRPANTWLSIEVDAGTAIGDYVVDISATSGGVVRNATFTLDIQAVPAPVSMQPVNYSSTANIATWMANMATYGVGACTNNVNLSETNAWYYDGQRVFLQMYDITADTTWLTCAGESETLFRTYVLNNNGAIPGWRVFPHGIHRDFTETADASSEEALLDMAANGAYSAVGGTNQSGISTGASREIAYMLSAKRLANDIGTAYTLTNYATLAIGHLTRWSEASRPYLQPFMVGLTTEALIDYYVETEDPRIPTVIENIITVLWDEYWVADDESFLYEDGDTVGAPDLNMLIGPAFAWVYRMTGDETWAQRADAIFNGGVDGAYLVGGKQFSQHYRWSPQQVEWMTPEAPAEGEVGTVIDGNVIIEGNVTLQ